MQKFELIVTIINRGFSELVMDSARASGATGGTILNARGTVAEQAQKIMGISIQPEKEVVLILTKKDKRNDIMTAICRTSGLNTPGKGIIFALPVDDVLGISMGIENFEEMVNAKTADNTSEEKEEKEEKAAKETKE